MADVAIEYNAMQGRAHGGQEAPETTTDGVASVFAHLLTSPMRGEELRVLVAMMMSAVTNNNICTTTNEELALQISRAAGTPIAERSVWRARKSLVESGHIKPTRAAHSGGQCYFVATPGIIASTKASTRQTTAPRALQHALQATQRTATQMQQSLDAAKSTKPADQTDADQHPNSVLSNVLEDMLCMTRVSQSRVAHSGEKYAMDGTLSPHTPQLQRTLLTTNQNLPESEHGTRSHKEAIPNAVGGGGGFSDSSFASKEHIHANAITQAPLDIMQQRAEWLSNAGFGDPKTIAQLASLSIDEHDIADALAMAETSKTRRGSAHAYAAALLRAPTTVAELRRVRREKHAATPAKIAASAAQNAQAVQALAAHNAEREQRALDLATIKEATTNALRSHLSNLLQSQRGSTAQAVRRFLADRVGIGPWPQSLACIAGEETSTREHLDTIAAHPLVLSELAMALRAAPTGPRVVLDGEQSQQ